MIWHAHFFNFVEVNETAKEVNKVLHLNCGGSKRGQVCNWKRTKNERISDTKRPLGHARDLPEQALHLLIRRIAVKIGRHGRNHGVMAVA